MKYIQKQAEPLILTELKQKSNPDLQRSYADLRIEPFLDDDISQEDFQLFIQGYLSPSNSGEFSEFWTTINDVFGTEKFI